VGSQRLSTGRAGRRRGELRSALVALALFAAGPFAHAQAPAPDAPLLERFEHLAEITAPDSGWTANALYDTAFDLVSEARTTLAGRPVGPALAALADAAQTRGLRPLLTTWIDNYALIEFKSAGATETELEAFVQRALARAPTDSIWSGSLRTEYADLLRTQGRYADALEQIEIARAFYPADDDEQVSAADRMLLATHLGVAGECWLRLGLPDIAAPYFEREGKLAQLVGDRLLRQAYHDHRMKTAQVLADYERLSLSIDAALADPLLAAASPTYRAKLEVRRLLARLELELEGAPRGEAERRYAELLDNDALDEYDRREADMHGALLFADEQKDAECLTAIARLRASKLHDLAIPNGETLEYEACARAFELEIAARRDPTRAAEPIRRLHESFEAFLEWWKRSPERSGGVGFLAAGRRRYIVDAALRAEQLLAPGEAGVRRAFAALMEVQSAGSLTQALGAATPTLDEAARVLCPAGTALLCYLPGRRGSHLFALDAAGARRFDLPAWNEIEGARRELEVRISTAVRALARWNDPQLTPSLVRASDALLPSAARAYGSSFDNLIVVGLDSIGYTPLEALLDPRGEPLGARCAITYAPSVAAAVRLTERDASRPRATPQELARIVAPSMDRACLAPFDLPPFETPADTLQEIADVWSGAAALFAGASANREVVETARCPLLHLITHGYFDRARELQAAVLLAGQTGAACEAWWSDDAARMNAPPIVVLTACGAGRGPRRFGDDGRAGFAGQFLPAGADAIVLSQVELELGLALEHSLELHRALARGETISRALVSARRALSDDPAQTPLQHLLVHVIGNGSARAFSDARAPARDPGDTSGSSTLRILAAVGALIVVGAAGVFLNRRRSAVP